MTKNEHTEVLLVGMSAATGDTQRALCVALGVYFPPAECGLIMSQTLGLIPCQKKVNT